MIFSLDVCLVESREVTTDEIKTIKSPSGKADVVFVVQLHSGNRQLYKDFLLPLSDRISQHLTKSGIK